MQALRRRRRPVTAATLAGELGVSARTLYRDIATLVAGGAPIEGEAGLGYVLQNGHFLPPLMFTPREADAVMLGLMLARRRGDAALDEAAAEAQAKIAAVLPPEVSDSAAVSGLMVPARDATNPHLATILAALREERTLTITYVDRKGRDSTRTIWPVAVGFFDAADMLAAWCEGRDDFRHFRLDRIRSVEPGPRYPARRRILLAQWRAQELGDDGS